MPSARTLRSLLRIAATLVLLVLCARGGVAQDAGAEDAKDDGPLPVGVTATVDESRLESAGLFTIAFEFAVEKDVKRAATLVVGVVGEAGVLLQWDHAPTPPTLQWKKGQTVRSEITGPLPRDRLRAGESTLGVMLGFRDTATGKVTAPDLLYVANGQWARVAEIRVPELQPLTDEQRIVQVLATAEELAAAGRRPDAWAVLEHALRAAPDDVTKYRLRNAMVKLGDFAPRPLTEVEKRIVEGRIADERRRYLREEAGRLYDRGRYHAALRILEDVGGRLEEAANSAVLGALADAKRVERDLQDIREKIWERVAPEDKDEAQKALETLGRTKAALEKARGWVKEGRFGIARRVLRDLAVTAPKDVASAASEEARALEKTALAAISPEEQAAADAALRHPSFARTTYALSHEFVFIGPKTLVEGIPAGSRTAFDLAYVFVTDLFGRRPNPEGDRVTVYFKELWDFGGGVGGGKIIDIGNAKPDAVGTTVDNGLLFHELTHCVDDTAPIHHGFREGLADFGATYAHEALGRPADAARGFQSALQAFRKDYVDRDLAYWRIPNYGPSAGFFLHFSEAYAKAGVGHDWKPWRQFFREYRKAAIRDGREPYVMRSFAHFLVRAFGPRAFDDLLAFRFPLVPTDRAAVLKEMETWAEGEIEVVISEGDFATFPNSPLPRDLAQRRALEMHGVGSSEETRRICREELGIVYDWRVIGPFEPQGADPGAQVFPPEHEIDLAKEYPQRMNVARWKPVTEPGPVAVDDTGWVQIQYGYMDNTATYALTHVTAAEETDVFFHVRSDDDFSLFVNDDRIDGFLDRGSNDSTRLPWRGPVARAPDMMRLPARLRPGRNKVLLKIRNRSGPAGFVLAVSGRGGRPVPGLVSDLLPPAATKPRPEPKWHAAAKLDFRTKAPLQKCDVPVGGFDVVNKALSGTAATKGVAWRKYTVRPGFPKDSPSNLLWLGEKLTAGIDDFRLTIELVPRDDPPKLAVTFQGEGGNDGLSGWNLLLWSAGKGRPAGQLERYEDLVYQWPVPPAPEAKDEKDPKATKERKDKDDPEPDRLVLTYRGRRLTVALGARVLLDEVSIRPIPGRERIGLSTWGAEPRIVAILLETPK